MFRGYIGFILGQWNRKWKLLIIFNIGVILGLRFRVWGFRVEGSRGLGFRALGYRLSFYISVYIGVVLGLYGDNVE